MSKNKNKRASSSVDLTSAKKKTKATAVSSPVGKKIPEKPIYTSDESSSSSSESVENSLINTVANEVVISNGDKEESDSKNDLPAFTFDDMNKLLDNVRKVIPDGDSLKYNTRLDKLDWEQVKFGNFSGEDCKKLLNHAMSFIRKYKTMNEVIAETQAAAAKPSNKMFKVRGSQRPRHPSSSYMIFANEIRDKLRKQNPTLSIIEIGKLIGEKWRQLPQTKKDKYVKQFEENKKVYLAEVTKYNSEHPEPEKIKKKEFDKPKAPLSIYLSEKLEKENPDLEGKSLKEKQTFYKNKYNQLSDKKKYKYIKKCLEAEDKFVEKLKDKLKTANVDYKSVLNKQERDIVEKMNGKPDSPPVNGYALFIKENITTPEMSLIEPKLKNSILATKWKDLEKNVRESYNNRAKVAQEQFVVEMTNYVKGLPEKQAIELYMSSPGGLAKDIIARRIESLSK